MFMLTLMSIFIYRRPPCLMYKLTEKAHSSVSKKKFMSTRLEQIKTQIQELYKQMSSSDLLRNFTLTEVAIFQTCFFVIFCILTPVLIPPVHLLWVGNARLRCSSGHDRPLPLPQEGLHFLIILRSQRTPSFKPKMKQR